MCQSVSGSSKRTAAAVRTNMPSENRWRTSPEETKADCPKARRTNESARDPEGTSTIYSVVLPEALTAVQHQDTRTGKPSPVPGTWHDDKRRSTPVRKPGNT